MCAIYYFCLSEYLEVVPIESHPLILNLPPTCQDYFEFYSCPPRHLHFLLSLVSYVNILCASIQAIHDEAPAWNLQTTEEVLPRAVHRTVKKP